MSIADNIKRIQDEMNDICARCGRNQRDVRLMAVSKFHPRSSVDEARAAGITLFGESRVKEALEKFARHKTTMPGTELHLIGTLQRNKVKYAHTFFDCVESLDRDELIDELSKYPASPPLPVLLEVNSGEDTKSGYRGLDNLLRAAEKILSSGTLRLAGLMTLAPLTGGEAAIRAAFRDLAQSKEILENRFAVSLGVLSMGMSGDYKIAIEEGSTIIRIGTAIFGERS
jgi:pyridoxal phosphate enzyme (YggS family)